MLDWQETAVRNAFRDATWETVVEERNRYTKRTGTVAEEMRELLQTILEEKLAQDSEPTPAEWAKKESEKEKPKPLTAAEQKRRDEARLERITQGGKYLPPPKLEPSLTQSKYIQRQNLIKGILKSGKLPDD